MSDPETRAFYDQAAQKYAEKFQKPGKPDEDLLAFMKELPQAGHVLDLGCGPGRSARHMQDAGFKVTATDASQGMIDTARSKFGIEVERASFDDLTERNTFDGVFANFSLLHAARADIPRHLTQIHTALNKGGCLHIGMKLGEGEARDQLGRFYTYVTEDELTDWLSDLNFEPISKRVFEAQGMAGEIEPAIIMRARA